jgi:putative ABC transport system permease protein
MTSASKLLHRIYSLLLLCYPRPFRVECAREMLETLRMREEDLRSRDGHLRIARFWRRELWAVVQGGMRVRLGGAARPSLSPLQGSARVWCDLRFAARSLRRCPGFAVTAALTVALGIGATTVIFSFVNGILLSPLPYRDPSGLVLFRTFNERLTSVSEPEFMAFRTETGSLASVAAVRDVSRTLQLDQPRRIVTLEVTHELFPILGVQPLIGRTFTDREDLRGAARVTVLSHRLWRDMYGSDPAVLGKSIMLDGESFEVVGVMPAGFYFPSPEVMLWSPYQIDPADLDYWNNHYLELYGRLKDGVGLEAARGEVRAMGQRLVTEHPEYLKTLGFTSDLVPLFENMVGDTRTPLLILLGAVGFLLLIGCSNVASLLLARGENRKQEIAVRSALGASRGRVVTLLLMESLVISLVGGTVGCVLAAWGVEALRSAGLDSIPRIQEIGIDGRVLLFTFGITVLTGFLFGLLPAITASRSDLQTHLKEGARTIAGSRRSRRIRHVLVASEVALAVVLVIGAGVMLRSVAKLQRSDTGFRTDDVLTARVSLPENSYTEQERVDFYERLVGRVAALPGVYSAAVVTNLPLFQGIGRWSIQIRGREVATIGEAPTAELQQVTPGYFETMGLSLLEGRVLARSDDAGGRPVVVVNEAFVRAHWRRETAIGRQVQLYSSSLPWMDVVGVVNNVRHHSLLSEPRPKMYVAYAQASECCYGPDATMNLVVHGAAVEHLAGPIRNLVGAMSSTAPVYHVQTMAEVKAAAMADRSQPTLLLTVFGLLALFLAAIGIYGLVAFQVNQGRQNIALRVALGATSSQVRSMVLGKGLLPVLAGTGVGLVGAFGLTRLLRGLLYEVSAVDPAVYLGVSAILLLVAGAATLVPALRATRLDPIAVLRSE